MTFPTAKPLGNFLIWPGWNTGNQDYDYQVEMKWENVCDYTSNSGKVQGPMVSVLDSLFNSLSSYPAKVVTGLCMGDKPAMD